MKITTKQILNYPAQTARRNLIHATDSCNYLRAALAMVLASTLYVVPSQAAVIGIDNRHGQTPGVVLASGSQFSTFRSVITGMGHTIVPVNSFGAADLAGLDAVILNTPYSGGHTYSAADIAAVNSFANRRAVFVSDSTFWSNPNAGNDRPITFGDNQKLLENAVAFTSSGRAAIFVGENGTGFLPANMNALVAAYGVSYATTATDPAGRTVSGLVSHPVTAGLTQIGVDFQLPMTVTSPSIDLTIGGGHDNVLAVYDTIPEPMSLAMGVIGSVLLLTNVRSRRGRAL
jgi:hypothetical protein